MRKERYCPCKSAYPAFSQTLLRSGHYNRAWLPSQNGVPPVCLQPHQAMLRGSVTSTFFGAKPLPLCEPSQNGWPFDFPHAHHQ